LTTRSSCAAALFPADVFFALAVDYLAASIPWRAASPPTPFTFSSALYCCALSRLFRRAVWFAVLLL